VEKKPTEIKTPENNSNAKLLMMALRAKTGQIVDVEIGN
jgi:hypothetical protein